MPDRRERPFAGKTRAPVRPFATLGLRALAIALAALMLAAAAPHKQPQPVSPSQWFIMLHTRPPGRIGPFPTERDCRQTLAQNRVTAEAGWRQAYNDYYTLLLSSTDTTDDSLMTQRYQAYSRSISLQQILVNYRRATCEPGN